MNTKKDSWAQEINEKSKEIAPQFATPLTDSTKKCPYIHCRCMDIGGQCPNIHWYHCKEHNPDAYEKGQTRPVSQGKESSEFSDFFRKSPEEKEETMLEVAKDAANAQRAQIGLPPLGNSFTEKTLENFREEFPGALWMSMKGFGDVNLRPRLEQWLTSKLSEATQDVQSSSYDFGVENERQRILNLIESKKKEIPGESIDYPKSLRERDVHECGENDGRLAALNSLIEEIQK